MPEVLTFAPELVEAAVAEPPSLDLVYGFFGTSAVVVAAEQAIIETGVTTMTEVPKRIEECLTNEPMFLSESWSGSLEYPPEQVVGNFYMRGGKDGPVPHKGNKGGRNGWKRSDGLELGRRRRRERAEAQEEAKKSGRRWWRSNW